MMKIAVTLAVLTFLLLIGCGEGKDPYTILSRAQTVPSIGLPLDVTVIAGSVVSNVSKDRLEFPCALNASVVSPVEGEVVTLDYVSGTYVLTIHYNNLFSFQVANLAASNKRVGDYVMAGEVLGSASAFGSVYLTAFVNGAAACPFSYLNAASQKSLRDNGKLAGSGGYSPCP